MKNKYIYVDGKVVPCDEKNIVYDFIEYQDNINDILLTEGILEETKNNLKEVEIKKKELEKKVKEYKDINVYSPLFLCTVISIIMSIILNNIFEGGAVVYKGFTAVQLFTLIGCPLYTLTGGICTINNYIKKNKTNMSYNALCMEEEFLKKTITKQEEKITELKKDKTKDKESNLNNNEVVKINYKEYLITIKEALLMCHRYGFKKDYTKDYKNEKINEVEKFVDNKFKTLKKEYK